MQKNPTPIVGAWRLITFEFRKADGNVIYPFGEQARGSIIYTESGRYSAQLMRIDRPRFASGDQMKGTVEEIESNYKGCIPILARMIWTYKIVLLFTMWKVPSSRTWKGETRNGSLNSQKTAYS